MFHGGAKLYKTGLTRTLYNHFSTSFESFTPTSHDHSKAYVYVDANGFKLLTNVEQLGEETSSIFALATNEDGGIEALSLIENRI